MSPALHTELATRPLWDTDGVPAPALQLLALSAPF